MKTQKEALKLALEALEKHGDAYLGHLAEYQFAITKVKEALAQPEQEPVAQKIWEEGAYGPEITELRDIPVGAFLYTTQPQRKPLTGEKAQEILRSERCWFSNRMALIITRAIEAAHGIK